MALIEPRTDEMGAMWRPDLQTAGEDGGRPLHERLLAALASDIRSGALAPGARLPPQRALAYDLGLAVGTVTRAYAEAERRGLVTAHVGRGSFVASTAPRSGFGFAPGPADGVIDLARNTPPLGPAERRLGDALASLRRRADLLDAAAYSSPEGPPACRGAVALWLRRRHGLCDAEAGQLVLTSGAQQALALAFSVLCRPGDAALCEAVTFTGVKAIAEHQRIALHGVALDADGITPDALDAAAATTGARVLYIIPTLQNPTAGVMSAARRAEIVAVARRRDLIVVEDDVYAAHADPDARPTPLRLLAPERVWHVASVSKSLAPGLRVGWVAPPTPEAREVALRTIRAQCYAVPVLPALIAAQWIEDGTADAIADEIADEIRARSALAWEVLPRGILGAPDRPPASHLWLPMSELAAERAAGRALRAGVEVTPPSAPVVDASLASGLRLCLGAPPDRATLERGLRTIAAALVSDGGEAERAVV
jgi:DNA-binding transcriptional MocR family regulator